MEKEQLKIFIESIIHYFQKVSGSVVDVGMPFLKEGTDSILMDYTGAVGISGKMKGAIYITANDNFMRKLISTIIPGSSMEPVDLAGMAGELANTIAGNAQKTLGPEFHISIPMIFSQGENRSTNFFEIKAPTFIIPLQWDKELALLAVGLQKDNY